ncbi:hypothetical protein DB30_04985 [Enhygromyxa salina]|uniref:ER-bound oxygenase mpaB/mpaB'/Rubber oxygenase catalytic domain-containing protein n=1 Tax=Enhygromyxa salina TaxID=215803 RepID=A0A0C1ZXY4_9BACT|nr:oxygenase MpaB family protein [Enhygromyxa salina]KIG16113.1 hypothetical protein DB30_04985 [Enhygromyxa salina]
MKNPPDPHPAPLERVVDADELDRSMRDVFDVVDPNVGLFGPDTISWELYSQKAVWFGAMRANLLQASHPGVAAALVNNSKADVGLRLQTTIAFVDGVVFGTVDQARELAMKLHRKHEAVSGMLDQGAGVYQQGDPYEGNDLEALLWVLMTIVDTAVLLYGELVRPLSREHKDQLIRELPRLAAMFGIPERALARDWAGHEAYMRMMYQGPRTAVGDQGRKAAASVVTPSELPLVFELFGQTVDLSWLPSGVATVARRVDPRRLMFLAVRDMTTGWLPPHLRDAYGLDWSPRTQRRARLLCAALRTAMRLQPDHMRRAEGYLEAYRRIGSS